MRKTLAAVLAAGALLIGGIGSVDAANWYTVKLSQVRLRTLYSNLFGAINN